VYNLKSRTGDGKYQDQEKGITDCTSAHNDSKRVADIKSIDRNIFRYEYTESKGRAPNPNTDSNQAGPTSMVPRGIPWQLRSVKEPASDASDL
jgi:hypothetical protein